MFFQLSYLLYAVCANMNTEDNAADQTDGAVSQRNVPIHLHQVADGKPEFVFGKGTESITESITFEMVRTMEKTTMYDMTMEGVTHRVLVTNREPAPFFDRGIPFHPETHGNYAVFFPYRSPSSVAGECELVLLQVGFPKTKDVNNGENGVKFPVVVRKMEKFKRKNFELKLENMKFDQVDFDHFDIIHQQADIVTLISEAWGGSEDCFEEA